MSTEGQPPQQNGPAQRGVCLASQQIRGLIESKKIICPQFDESRVQPSSFEPTLGDRIWRLDTEKRGLIRPQPNATIYRTLLQLPGKQRTMHSISDGFEMKKGFTYLCPLEEKVMIGAEGEYILSSPKSSFGRLFVNTRLLADYNPSFDEISSQYATEKELQLWLLVQPLAFNMIVYPGLTLNQLRFFTGPDAKLNTSEVWGELQQNPIMYVRNGGGDFVPAKPYMTDDLQMHLDLAGHTTQGIVGFKARNNPTPIDLKRAYHYEVEDFFDPVMRGKDNSITISRGDYYLLASKEVLRIPKHLAVELKSHSHIGLAGPLHFAGFGDNGFEGDLVLEVRSDEMSPVLLTDNMPISKFNIFRTLVPDKLYGKEIGSNYKGQVGPRASKHFNLPDYKRVAQNYTKLSYPVLVQDSGIMGKYREKEEGFEFLGGEKAAQLFEDIRNGFFQRRYDCELDELVLQPIPYVVVVGPDGTVFMFIRASDKEVYGEEELFGKYSIGLGGHIGTIDAPGLIDQCIMREVMKEKTTVVGTHSDPKFVGTVVRHDEPVDRKHFGLVYVMRVDGEMKVNEKSITYGGKISISDLMNDPNYEKKYEPWSRALIPLLPDIIKAAGF